MIGSFKSKMAAWPHQIVKVFKLAYYEVKESWGIGPAAFLLTAVFLSGIMAWSLSLTKQDGFKAAYQPVSLSIVDSDQSMISQILVRELSDIEFIDQVYLESLDKAQERLAANEILLILVIPAGFYDQAVRGQEKSPLTIYLNDRMPSETAVMVRLFNNIADGIVSVQAAYFAFCDHLRPLYANNEKTYIQILDAAFLRVFFQMMARKSCVVVNDSGSFQTIPFVISGLLCLLSLLTSLLCLLEVQRDRKFFIQDRLKACGVNWLTLYLSRQMAGLFWLAAGFTPILIVLHFLFSEMNWTWICLSVFMLYFIGSAWFQAWGQFGSTGEEKVMGAWLILFLMLLLGGSIYPKALLPSYIRVLMPISPVYFAFQLLYQAAAGAGPDLNIGLGLIHLLVSIALVRLSYHVPYRGRLALKRGGS